MFFQEWSMNKMLEAIMLLIGSFKHFFFLEQKKVKVKKPKPEFPVYTPLESTYIQSYDHGTSIEEIEEQMDDWLENRNRAQKKQVNF